MGKEIGYAALCMIVSLIMSLLISPWGTKPRRPGLVDYVSSGVLLMVQAAALFGATLIALGGTDGIGLDGNLWTRLVVIAMAAIGIVLSVAVNSNWPFWPGKVSIALQAGFALVIFMVLCYGWFWAGTDFRLFHQ